MNRRSCRIAGLVGLFVVPLGCGSSDSGSAIQSGGSGGLGGYPAVGGTFGGGTAGYGYAYGGASGYGWGGANLGGYVTGSGGFFAGGNTGTLGGSSGNGGSVVPIAGGTPGAGGSPFAGAAGVGGRSGSSGGGSSGGASLGGRSSGGSGPSGGASSGGQGSGGAAGSTGACNLTPSGHYQMEDLDRGLVAVREGNGNYVGWRMFGYEYDRDNPSAISYNLYRDGTLLANVTDSTNYLDANGGANASYAVSAVVGGAECAQSAAVTPWAQNYLRIPLSQPGSGYEANDGSPGDLDGDGEYEIVLKWQPSDAQDNSIDGTTSVTYLDGIELDGTRLWRIDLGRNIRSGAHYSQPAVYDFDGDGKAEVAVKTAPGTKDGTGQFLHTGPAANDNDNTSYVNSGGRILEGPEYLTVFDGQTGAELSTIDYPVPRGSVEAWGDDYGNRVDRFNGGVSFVSDTGNGKTATGRPSIIEQRGYYTRLTISAINWRDGALNLVWTYDSDRDRGAAGQGNHSLMTADVDGDGAMELIPGSSTITSDGTFRCSTGLGHGDALHVGELVVGGGIHVYMPHEEDGGQDCHNASTCALDFAVTGSGDNGRGVAEYVSTSNVASASCSSGVGSVNCVNGQGSAPSAGSNFLIYWDADEVRELEDGILITKVGGGDPLLEATGCASNNGTKSTPTLTADLLGDWREELVLRESNNSALRLYTTTDVTTRRIYTLMHDPTYRMQVSFEQSSYNQPPHVGFHIGAGMAAPPTPNIFVR